MSKTSADSKKFNVYPMLRDILLVVLLTLLFLSQTKNDARFFKQICFTHLGFFFGVAIYAYVLVSLKSFAVKWRKLTIAVFSAVVILSVFMSFLTRMYYLEIPEMGSVMPKKEFVWGFSWLIATCFLLAIAVEAFLEWGQIDLFYEPTHILKYEWLIIALATVGLALVCVVAGQTTAAAFRSEFSSAF
jgi:hypothetical protein